MRRNGRDAPIADVPALPRREEIPPKAAVRRTQTSNIDLVVGAALGQGNPDFYERAGGAATLPGGYGLQLTEGSAGMSPPRKTYS